MKAALDSATTMQKADITSSTCMSYSEAEAKLNEPHSGFKKMTQMKHLALLPKFISNIKGGIKQHLDTELNSYSERLNGVLVAYSHIKLKNEKGVIYGDQPYVHLDIVADFIVFQPTLGSTLEGVVNKVGSDHIGCLVHGRFNASVSKPRFMRVDYINIGDKFLLTVDMLIPHNGVLAIVGSVKDKTLSKSKTPKKSRKTSDTSMELDEGRPTKKPKLGLMSPTLSTPTSSLGSPQIPKQALLDKFLTSKTDVPSKEKNKKKNAKEKQEETSMTKGEMSMKKGETSMKKMQTSMKEAEMSMKEKKDRSKKKKKKKHKNKEKDKSKKKKKRKTKDKSDLEESVVEDVETESVFSQSTTGSSFTSGKKVTVGLKPSSALTSANCDDSASDVSGIENAASVSKDSATKGAKSLSLMNVGADSTEKESKKKRKKKSKKTQVADNVSSVAALEGGNDSSKSFGEKFGNFFPADASTSRRKNTKRKRDDSPLASPLILSEKDSKTENLVRTGFVLPSPIIAKTSPKKIRTGKTEKCSVSSPILIQTGFAHTEIAGKMPSESDKLLSTGPVTESSAKNKKKKKSKKKDKGENLSVSASGSDVEVGKQKKKDKKSVPGVASETEDSGKSGSKKDERKTGNESVTLGSNSGASESGTPTSKKGTIFAYFSPCPIGEKLPVKNDESKEPDVIVIDSEAGSKKKKKRDKKSKSDVGEQLRSSPDVVKTGKKRKLEHSGSNEKAAKKMKKESCMPSLGSVRSLNEEFKVAGILGTKKHKISDEEDSGVLSMPASLTSDLAVETTLTTDAITLGDGVKKKKKKKKSKSKKAEEV